MRTHSKWLAAMLAPALAVAVAVTGAALRASAASAASNGAVRVMPLGDSITDGLVVPGGYRIGLCQRVVAGGYNIQFVGSLSNGPAIACSQNHEGHSGWRIDQIDANIVGWLNTQQPHTVLLHIGTNDVSQNYDLPNAPNRLSALIDHITATAPSAEVFVAQIIPLSYNQSQVNAFNAAVPNIVANKQAAGKHVHLVDMFDALTVADLQDGVHPNAAGYDKMAAVWYKALLSVPGSIGGQRLEPEIHPRLRPDGHQRLERHDHPGYRRRDRDQPELQRLDPAGRQHQLRLPGEPHRQHRFTRHIHPQRQRLQLTSDGGPGMHRARTARAFQ